LDPPAVFENRKCHLGLQARGYAGTAFAHNVAEEGPCDHAALLGAGIVLAQVTTKVEIAGAVAHPLSLSDNLRQLPVRQMDERRSVGNGNARQEQVRHHEAVLLRDLLDKVEIVDAARYDKRRSVLIATKTSTRRSSI
jgi:hypothetical protein